MNTEIDGGSGDIAKQIHLHYKKLGQTPLEALQEYAGLNGIDLKSEPMTYAGRLDPMAEGLMIFLSGEATKKSVKDTFLNLPKTYQAVFLLGIETDSYDLLGMPQTTSASGFSEDTDLSNNLTRDQNVNIEECQNAMSEIQKNSSLLKLPIFSSPPIDGKPLWVHAKNSFGSSPDSKDSKPDLTPKKPMQILDFKISEKIDNTSSKSLLQYIESAVQKVSGDFRQKEILSAWRELCVTNSRQEKSLQSPEIAADQQTLQMVHCEITCTGGTYIRSIANEFGKILGTKSCLFSLKRTDIGEYKLRSS
jgi:tRNA U55 pseudouridine synthase TruB